MRNFVEYTVGTPLSHHYKSSNFYSDLTKTRDDNGWEASKYRKDFKVNISEYMDEDDFETYYLGCHISVSKVSHVKFEVLVESANPGIHDIPIKSPHLHMHPHEDKYAISHYSTGQLTRRRGNLLNASFKPNNLSARKLLKSEICPKIDQEQVGFRKTTPWTPCPLLKGLCK